MGDESRRCGCRCSCRYGRGLGGQTGGWDDMCVDPNSRIPWEYYLDWSMESISGPGPWSCCPTFNQPWVLQYRGAQFITGPTVYTARNPCGTDYVWAAEFGKHYLTGKWVLQMYMQDNILGHFSGNFDYRSDLEQLPCDGSDVTLSLYDIGFFGDGCANLPPTVTLTPGDRWIGDCACNSGDVPGQRWDDPVGKWQTQCSRYNFTYPSVAHGGVEFCGFQAPIITGTGGCLGVTFILDWQPMGPCNVKQYYGTPSVPSLYFETVEPNTYCSFVSGVFKEGFYDPHADARWEMTIGGQEQMADTAQLNLYRTGSNITAPSPQQFETLPGDANLWQCKKEIVVTYECPLDEFSCNTGSLFHKVSGCAEAVDTLVVGPHT